MIDGLQIKTAFSGALSTFPDTATRNTTATSSFPGSATIARAWKPLSYRRSPRRFAPASRRS